MEFIKASTQYPGARKASDAETRGHGDAGKDLERARGRVGGGREVQGEGRRAEEGNAKSRIQNPEYGMRNVPIDALRLLRAGEKILTHNAERTLRQSSGFEQD